MPRFLNVIGEKKKPTKNHRPAVWEMMLGTVNAMNEKGEVRYFDYDHKAALNFANVFNKSDIRIYREKQGRVFEGDQYSPKNIRRNQLVLWVEKGD